MLDQDIREFHRPNRRGCRARMVQMRPLWGQAVGASIFVERSTPKIGALVPKRRVRTALAHKPGQTRPQESGILRNVTYRQDIRGDFVVFKTLTRRRNPVSQLVMPVGVQIFAGPLLARPPSRPSTPPPCSSCSSRQSLQRSRNVSSQRIPDVPGVHHRL